MGDALISVTALTYSVFGDRIPALGAGTSASPDLLPYFGRGRLSLGTAGGIPRNNGDVRHFRVCLYTGVGQAFIDLAFAAFRVIRGGPAKVAV